MSSGSTTVARIFKGKDVRSWQQLPPEIVRLVATHSLLLAGEAMYTPNTWLQKETWPSRLLYVALRNATEIEKLMDVCPPWAQAREYSFMRPLVLLDVCPSRPRRVLAPGIVLNIIRSGNMPA
ncbi:hypothetical protein EIP86_010179 [Pleurotus ostreatoroseus]|nr:hypothetical protein EIP86_010179 [Pleurotus ostreatoroseus]